MNPYESPVGMESGCSIITKLRNLIVFDKLHLVIMLSCVVCGVLFDTYILTMTKPSWETLVAYIASSVSLIVGSWLALVDVEDIQRRKKLICEIERRNS